jgi:hypothetical protein
LYGPWAPGPTKLSTACCPNMKPSIEPIAPPIRPPTAAPGGPPNSNPNARPYPSSISAPAYAPAHPAACSPWDSARGQVSKCRFCKTDCTWVMCSKCADLISKGLPPQRPKYRPRKQGPYRRHHLWWRSTLERLKRHMRAKEGLFRLAFRVIRQASS